MIENIVVTKKFQFLIDKVQLVHIECTSEDINNTRFQFLIGKIQQILDGYKSCIL